MQSIITEKPWRSVGRGSRLIAALAAMGGLGWAMTWGYERACSKSRAVAAVTTVEIDRGDIAEIVTETGSVEGSEDDVVRCRVEAFLGLPVAASAGAFEPRGSQPRRPRATAAASSSSKVSTAGPALAATANGGSRAKSPSDGGKAAAKGTTPSAPRPAERPTTTVASTTDEPSTPTNAPEPSRPTKRPVIRSFNHKVEPHVPLRLTIPAREVIATSPPSPPTILSILPEGTRVRADDVVCELDSSAFRQALQVQQLRHVQARSWVEQARYILEANEIALREYRDGILPQDIELVRHHIAICEADRDRAVRSLDWARAAFAKGYRTMANVDADAARVQVAEITLRDAQGMLGRLVKYTSKRILKARKAKIAAIHADMLSLEACFQLESERLRRIEAMIAHCTMRAPRDGVIVYAHRTNGWGMVEARVREGMTVYQSQPIFRLLDPRRMHVKARINESQVARVRSGQPVSIRLDAFPDRVLKGSVAEIMPVPSLAKGPFSDVHTFNATVRIESGGFDALRSGLTAELDFLTATRRQVSRVPLEAVRKFGKRTFAAIVDSSTTGLHWAWRQVELGVSDTTFAEVVSGLEPGDRVIAEADSLPSVPPNPTLG
jgi:multidrug efflux pump subunit AcrA (membrane-fusion protein)